MNIHQCAHTSNIMSVGTSALSSSALDVCRPVVEFMPTHLLLRLCFTR